MPRTGAVYAADSAIASTVRVSRGSMLPSSQMRAVEASVLRPELCVAPYADVLAWYGALITARRDHPELRDPAPRFTAMTEQPGGFDLHRGPFTPRVNLSDGRSGPPDGRCVLASRPLSPAGDLPPVSCALFRR